jgi:hypothetical protein
MLSGGDINVAHDPTRDELFVVDAELPGVLVFDRQDEGNVAPKRAIVGANTGFYFPTAVTPLP